MRFILATESNLTEWIPVIVEVIIGLTAIFGGAGFWQYQQTKYQTKLDKERKEHGVEKKVDTLSENVSTLSSKVDSLSADMQQLKADISLLDKANGATLKYRETREKRDKALSEAQQAVIESLTGILRERLLENYNRCIQKGYYTKAEREVYKEMFRCYTSAPFNGNGVIHDLQPIMQGLPWSAEEAEAKKAKKSTS